MELQAGKTTLSVAAVTKDKYDVAGVSHDAIRILLVGGVSGEQLTDMTAGAIVTPSGTFEGYTQFAEHSLVFVRPRASDEEVEDMRSALKLLGVKKAKTWVEAVKSKEVI